MLTQARGNPLWDAAIRATGVIGLAAIPLALAVPDSGPLIGFALVTIWINGPVSFLFPAMYEPILIGFGAVYPPLLVAALGVAATIFVEFLNYFLYKQLLTAPNAGIVVRRAARVVVWFRKAPFLTVVLCSSILPYWPLRFIAPLAGYPVDRYLLATGVGRFPRLWFFAAVGSKVSIDPRVLIVIALSGFTVALTQWLRKRHGQRTT